MASHAVLVVPQVAAPDVEQAFLPASVWASVAAIHLVNAEDGAAAALATEVRIAWSARGLHVRFRCDDPYPYGAWRAQENVEDCEVVGVLLDPVGERAGYMAIMVNPFGRVTDVRMENPRHHAVDSEADVSWACPGLQVRSTGEADAWTVELMIPFSGMTPVIAPPAIGARWTANFFRVECQPFHETTAWQPSCRAPADLHDSDAFGVLAFGPAVFPPDQEIRPPHDETRQD